MGFAEVAVLISILSTVLAFEAPPSKFLFVVGGETPDIPDNTVEVVSFNETLIPLPECMKNIADYPEEGLEGSTGVSFPYLGGSPLVCGGLTGPGEGTRACHAYYPPPFNAWSEYGRLYAEVVYPAHSNSEDLGLVIIGGNILRGSAEALVSDVVAATQYSGYWKFGPPLQRRLHSACLVILDDDVMVLSGGTSAAVHPTTGNEITGQVSRLQDISGWTSISDLNVPRFSHGCGVVRGGDNEVIVVAGGVGANLIELDSVEMYEVGVATSWTMGSPLPMAMHRASSVQIDRTFVLVGGYSRANEGHLDTVLAYNPEGGRWEELQSMSRKRASATAMLIDAEVFHEC